MIDYVVWEPDFGDEFCILQSLIGVDSDWELDLGISRKNNFPDDAYFEMNPNFKKQIKLADILKNQNRLLCVSKNIKEYLEEKKIKKIEFYSIKIVNHKGKIASNDYFILNPLVVQDVLDTKQSKITWNPINEKAIIKCRKLIFDEKKLDTEVSLIWRLKYKESRVFIHKSLSDEMKNMGFTNSEFTSASEYQIK